MKQPMYPEGALTAPAQPVTLAAHQRFVITRAMYGGYLVGMQTILGADGPNPRTYYDHFGAYSTLEEMIAGLPAFLKD